MSQIKRLRIPSNQQVQRWANLITDINHQESIELKLELIGAPSEEQWDNFLIVLDQLEIMAVDKTEEAVKKDLTFLNNKRKL
jgi:hypothetical protein